VPLRVRGQVIGAMEFELDRGDFTPEDIDLVQAVAERFGLAVVPGVYFSDFGARWIRFSYALPPAVASRAAARLWDALEAL